MLAAARPSDLARVLNLAATFYIEEGFTAPVSELRDNLAVLAYTGTAGVAAALIDDSADWARSRGCRPLEVVVAPNGNNAAHLFGYYALRNFTDEGRRLLTRKLTD